MQRVFCVLTAVLILWAASANAASLPADLTVIEDEAFYGVSITELAVPEGVTSIGARAFSTAVLQKDCWLVCGSFPTAWEKAGKGKKL